MLSNHKTQNLNETIINFLESRPWGSEAPMAQCAQSMNMSTRTLRRRLAEHQTTFSEVFEDWRFTAARRLVAKRDMPIAAIAAILGYKHASNFERAFKRWTGVSPSEFRAHSKYYDGL